MSNKQNLREVITADSPFEATLLADEKYGKGNYTIIDCVSFTEHKYLGLVKHEIYNLYIELKKAETTKNDSTPKAVNADKKLPTIKYKTQDEIVPDYLEESRTADSISHAGVTYNSKGKQHTMRYVDGMRSIQEGDNQPHSQKNSLESGKKSNDAEAASILLEHIQKVRASRGHSTLVDLTSSNKDRNDINANLTKQLQELMNQMRLDMTELKKAVAQKLAEPIPNYPCGLKAIKESLINVDTPLDIAEFIVKSVSESTSDEIQNNAVRSMKAYESWCNQHVNFTEELSFETIAGPKIIALFGPTGVGKTTTIAKIAAPYTFGSKEKRKRIAFFTLDTFRLGATEQLAHYAQLYDIVLEVIYEPEEIDKKLTEHFDKDLIIIDTAGRCPKKRDELLRLNEYLSRLPNLSRYLVMSATSKYIDMINTIKCFNEIGFDNIIFTKLDETCSVGPMLAVMLNSKTPLAYFTNGQGVPYDILPANKENFSKSILENTLTII